MSSKLNVIEEDYSQRVGASYIIGVYLATNAVRDLYTLIEGPDCAHMKTQYIQGNHDWLSTLTSVSGFHRVANTALHPDKMTDSREEALREHLEQLAGNEAVPGLAMTSMPMAFVTGADYERLVGEMIDQTGTELIAIPGKSLSGDWLDGYAETLNAFAAQLDVSGAAPAPNKVGIVGNLFDRNEADHTANLVELEQMLGALGLEVVSIWFSGGSFEALGRIRDAQTIISLPYGRRAARKLKKRLGVDLVEAPLPFGLPASEAFMRQLGEHFGKSAEAEAYIDQQMVDIAPKLEWLIPYVFESRRVAFVGEPNILPGLASYLESLGMVLHTAMVTNRPPHMKEVGPLEDVEILVYPRQKAASSFISEVFSTRQIDLLISNNYGVTSGDIACFEFGFPSIFRHALYPRPFLGFGGALAFADTMANVMRQQEVVAAHKMHERAHGGGPPDDHGPGGH